MVSYFILVFSAFALVKFGIAQWRSIWITAASRPISETLQLATGTDGNTIGARDFRALLELCDKVSPGLKKTSPWLREVSIYYRLVLGLEKLFQHKVLRVAEWASREMQCCSRYVAVLLDQNLSMNMDRQLATRTN
jgi:hypothetical protein